MYFSKSFIKKLFRLGFLLVIILLLLDLITFFLYPDSKIGEIFLATREQTPLTWVSSVVLLLIAFSCVTFYLNTKSKIWYLLSFVFLFFSMDDATYFHERFSAVVQKSASFLYNFPSYSWVVLYLPLLIFGLGAYTLLLWEKSSRREKATVIIGVLLLATSLLLDMIDGWVEKDKALVFCIEQECNLIVAHIFRLIEEILEIFGFGILLHLSIKQSNKFFKFDGEVDKLQNS